MLEEEECGAEWEWGMEMEEGSGELAVQGCTEQSKCQLPKVGEGVGRVQGSEPVTVAMVGGSCYSVGSGNGEKDSGDSGSSQPWSEQGLAAAAAASEQVPLLPAVKQYCSAQRMKYVNDPAVVSVCGRP
jgi:hypothetical protein